MFPRFAYAIKETPASKPMSLQERGNGIVRNRQPMPREHLRRNAADARAIKPKTVDLRLVRGEP